MAVHINFGKEGEKLAETWLLENGFTILHRNWRHSHYEIDLIALKNNKPHFIEVKMRSSKNFGWPEESVSRKKIRSLLQAINQFLYLNPPYKDFRIDILSIISRPGYKPEYFFIEDVS
jgi:putative endonuclease